MPFVSAFCGLPGSGKSTLARMLECHTGWRRLDRDALRGRMFSSGGYSHDDKQQLAVVMRGDLQKLLLAGESVILDGMTLSRHAEREEFRQHSVLHGAHWLLVWLDCDVDTAKRRIRFDTAHPAADRNPALVDDVAARFERPVDAWRLDGMLTTNEQLHALLAEIRRHVQEVR